jgi:hypothetical protein
LLLPARQCADLPLGERSHPNPLEGVPDRAAIFPAGTEHRADMRIAAHHDDLAGRDRKAPVDELALRDVGDPPALDQPAVEANAPDVPRHEAEDGPQERALAAAVRTDDPDEPARRNVERDVFDRPAVVVAGGKVAEFERGRGHGETQYRDSRPIGQRVLAS